MYNLYRPKDLIPIAEDEAWVQFVPLVRLAMLAAVEQVPVTIQFYELKISPSLAPHLQNAHIPNFQSVAQPSLETEIVNSSPPVLNCRYLEPCLFILLPV
jgi:hypothetical protein